MKTITECPVFSEELAEGGTLAFSTLANSFSAMIVFASWRAAFIAWNRSCWSGRLALALPNEGITPKTSIDGTNPLSPAVSFNYLTA